MGKIEDFYQAVENLNAENARVDDLVQDAEDSLIQIWEKYATALSMQDQSIMERLEGEASRIKIRIEAMRRAQPQRIVDLPDHAKQLIQDNPDSDLAKLAQQAQAEYIGKLKRRLTNNSTAMKKIYTVRGQYLHLVRNLSNALRNTDAEVLETQKIQEFIPKGLHKGIPSSNLWPFSSIKIDQRELLKAIGPEPIENFMYR